MPLPASARRYGNDGRSWGRPFYLGKLIVYAQDREEAIRKMEAALCEMVIQGVETNIEDFSNSPFCFVRLAGRAAHFFLYNRRDSAFFQHLIVYAQDREEAIRKMEAALCEMVIHGVETNIEDQLRLVRSKAFFKGEYRCQIFFQKNVPVAECAFSLTRSCVKGLSEPEKYHQRGSGYGRKRNTPGLWFPFGKCGICCTLREKWHHVV